MKVAIVGMADSTRHLTPWNESGWEVWGMAWDPDWPKFHRTFEMHEDHSTARDYLEKLECCNRLYMPTAKHGATAYPYDSVAHTTGAYWCSSVAYMLALAIHEKAECIALYGVDMAEGTDYFYQRPNVEYLIGLARGKGIEVLIPESCPITKHINPPEFEYSGRYGTLK